ncbi:MAG: transcription elongation protein SprT [Pseudarcicella sp.]|nr:transcription elongation protein SprT [Pseudarcicella sp.]MBP6410400.1 transcription elongation protein SprT [Pseudarcicella sp.]
MEKDYKIFQKYFPPMAVEYCFTLWSNLKFKFKITQHRNSKLGDYSYSTHRGHNITINHNLNPYSFLVTYIHEVAHMITFQEYKGNALPHGIEWKRNFLKTFLPILNSEVLPETLLQALTNYLKNPKASSLADPKLVIALRVYDTICDTANQENTSIELNQLPLGTNFKIGNRLFSKGELRRTRYLCTDLTSNKKYLITSLALVKKV